MLMNNAEVSISPCAAPPRDDDYMLVFRDKDVLLAGDASSPRMPSYAQVQALLIGNEELVPFRLAGSGSIAVYTPYPYTSLTLEPGGELAYQSIRAFQNMDEPFSSLLQASYHLICWYKNNRYCGRCGEPFIPSETERALCCGKCGNIVYPTITPAVIVAITRHGKLLLARNRNYVHKFYTLIAGYVEVGETLEQTVRREVMEEVGLSLGKLKYIGDQPWGLSCTMMFAFHAEATGDEPIVIQESELCDADWYDMSNMPSTPPGGSIANALVKMYINGEL